MWTPPSELDHVPKRVVPRNEAAVARNLPYATYPGRQLQLLMDLYRPDLDADVPVVVWFHDGGWRSGSKDHCPVRWLVNYGYAVAAVNYRLVPRDTFPAQIHDAKAAVRYVRGRAAEFGLKPDAIAGGGASTGAYLAAMLGTTEGVGELERASHGVSTGTPNPTAPDDIDPYTGQPAIDTVEPQRFDTVDSGVNAVVNFNGFTDFPALQSLPSRCDKRGLTTPEARFLAVPPARDPDLAAFASPITHVRPGLPPFIHLHGEDNAVVPLDQSRRFHTKLQDAGVTSKLVVLRHVGHSGRFIFRHYPAQGYVVDFLNRHMTGYVPAAPPHREAG